MHYTRVLFRHRSFRNLFRYQNVTSGSPIVKVFDLAEEDHVKVSFKLSNSPKLNVRVAKQDSLHAALSRIKLMAELQRKKEEIRHHIINKYSSDSQQLAIETDEEDIDVCLYQSDQPVDIRVPNSDAWSSASTLKIGDTIFAIKYNAPTVIEMTLPEYIISGCIIRPHFIFELASVHQSEYEWFRSPPVDESVLIRNVKSSEENSETESTLDIESMFVDSDYVKIGNGLTYFTTPEDTGCYLKLICTPKKDDKVGEIFQTFSVNPVEKPPDIFPFEERQAYTKTVCGDDSIRCLTYNILANCYVERKKFPYCSKKARDIHFRKQILLKELLGYNSDIICLQEVQDRAFQYDLSSVLSQNSFEGYYTRKGGRRYEGLATFYRTSKFRLLKSFGIRLNEILKEKGIFTDLLTKVAGNLKDMSRLLAQDNVLQVTLLEHVNQPERKLLVANTHLYSNKDTPEVRLIQAAVCTYYIEHIMKSEELKSPAVLFCGDFNSLPDSWAFEYIMKGQFECCSSWQNNSNSTEDTILRHSLKLSNACGTPKYTNYTEEFQGCLDYIFYGKELLTVREVLPLPSHDMVTAQVGLPSEFFPSDHIALICTLDWSNS